ncbi:unnamed protein product [Prorocentrum cordatum]|uniref:Uncharacterized protein n=1 Tax=Prorocentrum cordatum TaxID=2364126 RepID=A0ABN9PY65_9DINO|nr:unnamed protein product [Polarella glacialis]
MLDTVAQRACSFRMLGGAGRLLDGVARARRALTVSGRRVPRRALRRPRAGGPQGARGPSQWLPVLRREGRRALAGCHAAAAAEQLARSPRAVVLGSWSLGSAPLPGQTGEPTP